eukprot:TRINITY_DN688_c0_g1_i2.p1 TRINITY_DN688_c0_g1~~TRINITY_DN688_c0_g1_i2.p1  ORF type:complete len:246 (+),score=61.05 TRINITY_DN688_c0_g1_i2:70-807(+)
MSSVNFEKLLDEQIDAVVAEALREDSDVRGDVTSQATIPASAAADAVFLAKQNGILAGVAVATRVFAAVDAAIVVDWLAKDGDQVTKGQKLGTVKGNARALLVAERVALNLMQRMSGVATQTHKMVQACKPHATRILDTRKTAPCMRHLDKLAVRLGGGCNHRIGLFDMVLIKDNHVDVAGGIENALKATAKYLQESGYTDLKVEIETRNLEEVKQVLKCKQVQIRDEKATYHSITSTKTNISDS